jgi:hypothetical protein
MAVVNGAVCHGSWAIVPPPWWGAVMARIELCAKSQATLDSNIDVRWSARSRQHTAEGLPSPMDEQVDSGSEF